MPPSRVLEPSDDAKFEAVCEHYKDSFVQTMEYVRRRDRLLVWILLVAGLMLFQVFSPADADQALTDFITEKFELTGSVDASFVGSLVWFCLLIRLF